MTVPPLEASIPPDPVSAPQVDSSRAAHLIEVVGTVQGVGFRPFVWRLATALGLEGTVRNTGGRVEIEAVGHPDTLADLVVRLRTEAPARARVERVDVTGIPLPRAGAGTASLCSPVVSTSWTGRRSASFPQTSPPAPPACGSCSTRLTGDTCIRSSTAPTVGPGPASSTHSRTTGSGPPCPTSRCARTAPGSTRIRPTAGSTLSRSPARSAVRTCSGSRHPALLRPGLRPLGLRSLRRRRLWLRQLPPCAGV